MRWVWIVACLGWRSRGEQLKRESNSKSKTISGQIRSTNPPNNMFFAAVFENIIIQSGLDIFISNST
jgi:hypothetical protein